MGERVEVPALAVHYQPVVDLESGRVSGAEALIRFKRADGSLASPTEGGLIERIEADPSALAVLMEGLFAEIAREMVPLFREREGFYIGVNLPPVVLGTGLVKRIVDAAGVTPYMNRLLAEVTERQALTGPGREALRTARGLGVRVAVDDFGTGQSGLQQIMGLEFDVLKIDKSQVDPLPGDPTANRVLRGLVAMAGALRVRLTAEGVETREQAMFLHAAGVDCGQGWYWSKALPAPEFAAALDRGFAGKRPWSEPTGRSES